MALGDHFLGQFSKSWSLGDPSLGQSYLNLGLWVSFFGTELSKSGTQGDLNLWLWEIIIWDRVFIIWGSERSFSGSERSKFGALGDLSLGQRDLNLGLRKI